MLPTTVYMDSDVQIFSEIQTFYLHGNTSTVLLCKESKPPREVLVFIASDGKTQDKLVFGAWFLFLIIKEVLSKRIKISGTGRREETEEGECKVNNNEKKELK